jgi:ribonuclease E
MRDDSRPTDAFAWTRPWVPYGDDPFVWYDPAEDLKRAPAPANDAREAPRVAAEVAAPTTTVAAPRAESGDDIWVELPAVEDKPKRSRRGRGRGRGSDESAVADAPAEAVAAAPEPAPEPEPVVELAQPEPANDAPPAKKPRASRAKAKPAVVEAVVETVPEAAAPVVAVAEPEPAPPPAPRAPDPADISATPAPAPRKGWWRRG